MTNISKNLAFIPARGGSTGVVGKNIRELHGKPLVSHTVDFALSQSFFDCVLVSTDNEDIAEIATNCEVSKSAFQELGPNDILRVSNRLCVHRRLNSQAETLSPIREVLYDLSLNNDQNLSFDYLTMLQPTSPFRRSSELKELSKLINAEPEWTSIASFKEVGGFHPDRMYRELKNGLLDPYISQDNADNKPRQLLEKLFIKDGAYYVFKKENLQKRFLMGLLVKPILRQGLCTINIDTEEDFLIAQLVSKSII